MLDYNELHYRANDSDTRYIIHQGGTGSGKTFAILQYLLNYAVLNQGTIISVVAESVPHLKRGAIRDFKRIIALNDWSMKFTENKTDHCFKIGASLVEFFSADNAGKLRGPGAIYCSLMNATI